MKENRSMFFPIFIAVMLVLLLLVVGIVPTPIAVLTSVPSGYTGILTSYGKVEDTHLDAGIHFKLPWQKIVKMDNHIQLMHISSGVKDATTTDTAETRDQQIIPVFDFEIQYQLNPDMSYIVYSNYGANYENVLITSNALQFIKEAFSNYDADQIVSAKAEIPQQIKERLEEATNKLGVNILRVNMVTYDFSPEYTEILEQRAMLNAQLENNKVQQQNQTIAAQTEYEVAVKAAEKEAETQRIAAENANSIAIAQAKANAEKEKIAADNESYVTRTKAEAEKDARMSVAEAEKAELEARAAGLNDYVIQQEWIEKWNGALIPSFGSTGISFTDFTDIIKQYLPEVEAQPESVG